jgi:uncharacterized protein (DUF1501 family)
MRNNMSMFGRGIAALVQDLHERGLDQDVTVIVWGEFGRTPKINDKQGGRDHWPKVNGALLAGAPCEPVKLSVQPTHWPIQPKIDRSPTRMSWRLSITRWELIRMA